MRWLCTIGFLLIATHAAHSQSIQHADCGDDGTVHLLYEDGTTKQQPKEPLQVGCDTVTVGDDHATVGWSVLVENCCTSYPIATSIVVLSHGRKHVFPAEQMVSEWRFVSGTSRLAMLSGPVHGNAARAFLYDIQTGRRLATWNGTGHPPAWASGWKSEFGPS